MIATGNSHNEMIPTEKNQLPSVPIITVVNGTNHITQ